MLLNAIMLLNLLNMLYNIMLLNLLNMLYNIMLLNLLNMLYNIMLLKLNVLPLRVGTPMHAVCALLCPLTIIVCTPLHNNNYYSVSVT